MDLTPPPFKWHDADLQEGWIISSIFHDIESLKVIELFVVFLCTTKLLLQLYQINQLDVDDIIQYYFSRRPSGVSDQFIFNWFEVLVFILQYHCTSWELRSTIKILFCPCYWLISYHSHGLWHCDGIIFCNFCTRVGENVIALGRFALPFLTSWNRHMYIK